jgi:hypothetical protein
VVWVNALLIALWTAYAGVNLPQTTAATPTPLATLTASPASIPLPTPALFENAWTDRTLFQSGLIESEQAVLEQLPGASVYHLELTLGLDPVNLAGRQEVYYTNQENQPLNEIYFRLFPNLADGLVTITNLRVNDEAVEPSLEQQNSALRVPLIKPLGPGEAVVIQFDVVVAVSPEEGGNYGTFAFKDGVLALAHFYPLIPAYDDEGWNIEIAPYIGDVVYADSSFYLARITAPISQTLVASGVELTRTQTEAQQTVTYAAGPMRDFYLVASERYTKTSRLVGQTTINSYAPVELAEGAELALNQAETAMISFSERFGPYPFSEFDLVSTTTFALGVEYPGIVAILVDLYDPTKTVRGMSPSALQEGVVAHEVAHQWFYSLIGNDQVDEPWLDEALAQYATILYYQDAYGQAGAAGFRRSLERRWERVGRADIPIGLPVRDYDESSYGAIVYGRGPLFVELLAETMGPEAFEAFLRDYYQTYRWGTVTEPDFKQTAERHCGCDLTELFETWVYKSVTNTSEIGKSEAN